MINVFGNINNTRHYLFPQERKGPYLLVHDFNSFPYIPAQDIGVLRRIWEQCVNCIDSITTSTYQTKNMYVLLSISYMIYIFETA